jgi:hypothetical protein
MGPFLVGGVKILFALQAAQATVAGTVRSNDTNEPLAGLIVALPDLTRATRTDSAGRYVFRDVPPGPHHVAVRYLGFAPRTLHALVPPHGTLEINISLVPVQMRLPTLVVRRSIVVRGTDDHDAGASVDRHSSIAAVRNDPKIIEPDVLHALTGGDVVVRPESPSGLHVRGGASDHVAYVLDGIPVFSPYHTAGLFSAWNPDAMSAVGLSSSLPSPGDPGSLSGTVAASTRAPSEHIQTQGAASTTHARLTIDGPLGVGGAGYLVSIRAGYPRVTASRSDASYLRGGGGDRILKLETPALGGRLRMLRYDSEDEISASAVGDGASEPDADAARNSFGWSSRSLGAEWTGTVGGTELRALGWRASGGAEAAWGGASGPLDMAAARRDAGLLFAAKRVSARSTTMAGVRLERSRTVYRVDFQPDSVPDSDMTARTLVATGFAQHETALGDRATIRAGASFATFQGSMYVGPRTQLHWKASEHLSLSGTYTRLHQFAQSLRNAESMAGNVFPVELYMGAGAQAVPVARSDQGVLAADYRPSPGMRLGVQAYQRHFDGVLQVAPFDGEPFATRAFGTGRGASRGVAVDASVSSPRFGVVASYGLQHVSYESKGSSYVPDHGARHVFEGGVIVFPTPTASIRLGVTGSAGRRTTNVAGPFEWEACNLRDRGCEFGGTPRTSGETLGGSTLPFYARADLGVRKHWHLEVGGRDVVIALFGAATNLFGRRNLLTFSRDPVSGALSPVEMRPLAPLVAGLEWHF